MTERAPIDEAFVTGRGRPSRPRPVPNHRDIEIPIDHHPDTVRGDGPSARSARHAVGRVWDAWHRVREAAGDESVDRARLAKAAGSALKGALQTCDAALKTINAQVRELESGIVGKTQPRVEPALAAEIRSYWRERGFGTDVVAAAKADARTASALLNGPAYLSGLSEEQREVLRIAAVEAHSPELGAALREAERARDKVSTAGARMMATLSPKIGAWERPESPSLAALESLRG